ncbi:MAG TPA: PNGase F N-terminal domain-containing protein, partial [Hanamia sp.]|nr:PNGase F N-terminal domain-containing protein [Hanamia sp.]
LVQGKDPEKKEGQYIDYNQQATYQILSLKDGSRYTLKTPFSTYEKAVITGDTATFLGYHCKKAKVIIRSNTIEIWFTNELPIKGSPSLSVAPGLGLILKTVRNGNFETYATKIQLQKVSDTEVDLPKDLGETVDEATYHRKEIDNRFTTIPVFTHQQINFTDSIVNPGNDEENVTYRYAGGTLVLKKIKLPDTNNNLVFAHLSEYSNGDAYDRTGSVFIIPTDRKISFLNGLQNGVGALPLYTDRQGKKYEGVVETESYLPPLELMRFFTPFGVRYYNKRSKIKGYNWADSVNYKQDITDLLPRLKGEVWIGVFIGNYDKGGHIINLDLEFHPQRYDSTKKRDWVEPVFNTLNIMEMAGQNYGTMFDNDSLTFTVNIPEGLKNLKLRYISTGHGGWDNGDEFNQKLNEIFVDGKRVFSFIPRRTDCGTYRMYNPSSGNFSDGTSSSDYSRSNWCPGTTTNPVYIPLDNLTPGKHTFKIAIPLGKSEGSSFSAWNVSGCLIGEF